MKFPPVHDDTLAWVHPLLHEAVGNTIDFYGPCDHDPTGKDDIDAQQRLLFRGYFEDGEQTASTNIRRLGEVLTSLNRFVDEKMG